MQNGFESLTMQVPVALICFAVATGSGMDGKCLLFMPNPTNIYILWKIFLTDIVKNSKHLSPFPLAGRMKDGR